MPGPVARACDAVLDATVVLLATWTVVYHLSLVARLRSDVALLLEVALLVGVLVALAAVRQRRRSAPAPAEEPAEEPATDAVDQPAVVSPGPHEDLLGFGRGVVTVVPAVAAATAMAASFAWVLVWVSWLVAGVAGTAWAWRGLPR